MSNLAREATNDYHLASALTAKETDQLLARLRDYHRTEGNRLTARMKLGPH
jgi:hypothetical protein